MSLPVPRFVSATSYTDNDQLVYHIGTPADGSGFILKYHRRHREFEMYQLNFGPGCVSSSSASAAETAEAIALLPPDELARCMAASIAS